MTVDAKRRMRRKSMYGTALFVLGLVGVIVALPTGSLWVAVAGAILLIPGMVMLYQVGKSLS